MSIDKRLLALVIPMGLMLAPVSAGAAGPPTGVWFDDTGRGAVEIKPCGNGLCGNVVWVKDTSDTEGCGMQIIGDVKPVSPGTWDGGWIYSPEDSRKYDVELKPVDSAKLKVTGYMGTKLFSQTMIWTRAPADLQRCDAPKASAGDASGTQAAQEAAPSGGSPAAAAPAGETPKTADADAAAADTAGSTASTGSPSAKTEAAAAEPSEKATTAEAAKEDASEPKKDDELVLADGYSVSMKSGSCRLKTPFATLTFDCKK